MAQDSEYVVPFRYPSLDGSIRQIRLLSVDPVLDPHGRVMAQLSAVSLADASLPEYEALSWYWGDPRHQKEILVNGAPLQISANAVEVLEKVCMAREYHKVWLDAACINQRDLDERAQQVPLMEEIYSRAKRVTVWLGDDDKAITSSALASFDLLKNQFLECTEDLVRKGEWRYRIFHAPDYPSPVFTKDIPLPDCDWPAIESFFSSPWFSRLWVCQEVMLNRNVICIRGSLAHPWYDVGLAAQWLVYCRYESPGCMGKRVVNIDLAQSLWAYNFRQLPDWENLLWLGSSRHATIPVDHVYGVLGLVPKQSASHIVRSEKDLIPDYRKELSRVFAAATRVAIKSRQPFTNALNVLWGAQMMVPHSSDGPGNDEEWPSWVPRYDWDCDPEKGSPVPMHDHHGDNCAGYFRATQLTESPDEPLTLGLKGIIISTVTAVSRVFKKQLVVDPEPLAREILLWKQRAQDAGMTDDDFAMTLTTRKNHLEADAAEDPQFPIHYKAFITECQPTNTAIHWTTDSESFLKALWRGSANKRLFQLLNGYIGMGFPLMQPGDQVCILFSGMSPFILRPIDGGHRLVGHTYIHNIMHGEYIEQWKQQPGFEAQIRDFKIR